MENLEYPDLLVVPKHNKNGIVLNEPKNTPKYGELFPIVMKKSDLSIFSKVSLTKINSKLLVKNNLKPSMSVEVLVTDDSAIDSTVSMVKRRTKTKLPFGVHLNTDYSNENIRKCNLTPIVRVERITDLFIKTFCKRETEKRNDNCDRSQSRTNSVSRKGLKESTDSLKGIDIMSYSRARSKSQPRARSKSQPRARSKSHSRARSKSQSRARSESQSRAGSESQSRACSESQCRTRSESQSTNSKRRDESVYQTEDNSIRKGENVSSENSSCKSTDISSRSRDESKSESIRLLKSSSANESVKSHKQRTGPRMASVKSPHSIKNSSIISNTKSVKSPHFESSNGKLNKIVKVSLEKLPNTCSLETSNTNDNSVKISHFESQNSSVIESSKTIYVATKDSHSINENSNAALYKPKKLFKENKSINSTNEFPNGKTLENNEPIIKDNHKGGKSKSLSKKKCVVSGNPRRNSSQSEATHLEKSGKGEKRKRSSQTKDVRSEISCRNNSSSSDETYFEKKSADNGKRAKLKGLSKTKDAASGNICRNSTNLKKKCVEEKSTLTRKETEAREFREIKEAFLRAGLDFKDIARKFDLKAFKEQLVKYPSEVVYLTVKKPSLE